MKTLTGTFLSLANIIMLLNNLKIQTALFQEEYKAAKKNRFIFTYAIFGFVCSNFIHGIMRTNSVMLYLFICSSIHLNSDDTYSNF